MADASRILYNTLIPSFLPLQKTQLIHRHRHRFLAISRRHQIHCSVSAGDATKSAVTETIPWGCEIDSLENASDLQIWLSQSGLPPQKMAIEKVDVGERGLVALKNIRKGEKLLFVPPSLIITTDSVRITST